ncbi:MAG TPA: hypothetical protein VN947_29895 [Polyangia bacterium]|nr:hypothetical protein [Polyangia bacterium]
MALRLAWVLLVSALRLFGQPAPAVPAIDSPPPPTETRIVASSDDHADSSSDDPFDLDDDDDDDADVALPVRPVAPVPAPVIVRLSWSIHSLADKHTREPLFRPPQAA